MKRASLALVAVTIFTVVATSLYSQDQPQNQAPRPVRSRADETLAVLVQPEMERWRFPLASIPSFGRGFSRHRYDHQAIPQHGCVPAEPASVSPGKIIVAPPRPSVSTSGFPVTRPNQRQRLQTHNGKKEKEVWLLCCSR